MKLILKEFLSKNKIMMKEILSEMNVSRQYLDRILKGYENDSIKLSKIVNLLLLSNLRLIIELKTDFKFVSEVIDNDNSIEKILKKFLEKEEEEIYFPNNFSKNEIKEICEQYNIHYNFNFIYIGDKKKNKVDNKSILELKTLENKLKNFEGNFQTILPYIYTDSIIIMELKYKNEVKMFFIDENRTIGAIFRKFIKDNNIKNIDICKNLNIKNPSAINVYFNKIDQNKGRINTFIDYCKAVNIDVNFKIVSKKES